MLILPQEVEVVLANKNIKHFEEKGYEIPRQKDKWGKVTIPRGTSIMVKVQDLPERSRSFINLQCDYCGKEFSKRQRDYVSENKYSLIHKDCCKKCRSLKAKEVNLIKYNVENFNQLPESRKRLSDSKKIPAEKVYDLFIENNLTPINFNYIDGKTDIDFICNEHPELGIQQGKYSILARGHSPCKKCGYAKNSGENHHEWKGGISPLHEYLRGKIKSWKKDSFKYYNYKCCITGEKGKILIHHLYPFYEILQETLNESEITLHPSINEYSENELIILESKCLDLHYKYGLGVCLCESIHKLFHHLYGSKRNNKDQFEDFKTRLKSGEFSNFLEENNLKLVI